jgi:hypothetical protein
VPRALRDRNENHIFSGYHERLRACRQGVCCFYPMPKRDGDTDRCGVIAEQTGSSQMAGRAFQP